jgi:hypothetical protein
MKAAGMAAMVLALSVLAGCDGLLPGGTPQAGPGRAQAGAEAQPLLLARLLEAGTAARMRPSGRNGDVVTWLSPDNISISLAGGVLVATRGLGADLMSAEVGETRRMLAGHEMRAGGYPRLHARLDGEHRMQFSSYLCHEAGRRPETITLGDETRQTIRVTERCTAPDIAFDNSYWLGPDGLMWKSRQWVGAEIGHLQTERLRR